MLAREELSGASDAGLDLVGDEQRPVAPAQILRAFQITRVGKDDALALDRLDDESRQPARRKRPLERRQIVERDAHAIRQQRLETAPERFVSVQRQRAISQAVKGVAAISDAGTSRRAARELDRGLDRLRSGIGEENIVEMWN